MQGSSCLHHSLPRSALEASTAHAVPGRAFPLACFHLLPFASGPCFVVVGFAFAVVAAHRGVSGP